MVLSDQLKKMHGRLTLRAFNEQGTELWQHSENNLIVSQAYAITAEALGGKSNAHITKISVGTNGAPPTLLDTQITNAATFPVQSIEYPRPGTVCYNFTLAYTDAVGVSIREFGLMSDDKRLFARKVREPIEKTKYMSIVGKWEITI